MIIMLNILVYPSYPYLGQIHFAEIYVFVLDCGIGEANKEKLLYIADKYNRKIEFIEMKDMEAIKSKYGV